MHPSGASVGLPSGHGERMFERCGSAIGTTSAGANRIKRVALQAHAVGGQVGEPLLGEWRAEHAAGQARARGDDMPRSLSGSPLRVAWRAGPGHLLRCPSVECVEDSPSSRLASSSAARRRARSVPRPGPRAGAPTAPPGRGPSRTSCAPAAPHHAGAPSGRGRGGRACAGGGAIRDRAGRASRASACARAPGRAWRDRRRSPAPGLRRKPRVGSSRPRPRAGGRPRSARAVDGAGSRASCPRGPRGRADPRAKARPGPCRRADSDAGTRGACGMTRMLGLASGRHGARRATAICRAR
jgi:hypothetical protein